ncbi:MAG: class I SAM-dependent methyltransferase [Candidatus Doudnabacteria bacterium]|nr:class I SAM-dependent methyltransferase [Candidatus Doudnabacteria bacterium]
MGTTNVTPEELNYHGYTTAQYEQEIRVSIPFHAEVHGEIQEFLCETWEPEAALSVLDLGCGTGLTTQIIRETLPKSVFTLVDFSNNMLDGARQKFGGGNVRYVCQDYSKMSVSSGKYNIVASVIGLHHQTDVGKLAMFTKIRQALVPENGVFIFADLVTFRDRHRAALEAARHYNHLVEKATSARMLSEWAYHHMFLNQLAPYEDQLEWLYWAGFTSVNVRFLKYQTVLIVAQ